jgi:transcriptional regulator with XRE-family HTH domain
VSTARGSAKPTRRIELGPAGKAAAERVKLLRKRNGLSRAQLSARTAEAGRRLPDLAILRAENGDRRLDADDIITLAGVFGVSPLYLLGIGACARCDDSPPAGFACRACGAEGAA